MLTANILFHVGRTLFGNDCALPLARALDINPRSMQRMLKQEDPIPTTLAPDLIALLDQRFALLTSAIRAPEGRTPVIP